MAVAMADVLAQDHGLLPEIYDPSEGFLLQTADRSFSLHPAFMAQFRAVANFRQGITQSTGGGEAGGIGADNQFGFEVRRLRFSLDGNVLTPNIMYYVQFAADQGSSVGLLDAYVLYRISDQSPLALKAGQFKDPVWHEQNLLPSNLLAADRSLVNALIGGGQTQRVQGMAIIYDQDNLRGQLVAHDGYNSQNTSFVEAGGMGNEVGAGAGVTPTDFGLSVRAEDLVIGDRTPEFNPFVEYDQFTALRAKQDIVVLGGGADYSQSGSDNVTFHTLDASYESVSGLSAYAAYLGAYRHIHALKGVPLGNYYDSGALAQAGYMLTSRIEPFVRYDYTHLDGSALTGVSQDNIHEITVGANYYFHGQRAKATVDVSYLPNGCPTDVDTLGILKDDGHAEIFVRMQVQIEI